MRRLPAWATNAALACSSLLLTALALEGAARVLARREAASARPDEPAIARHHPVLGWERVPGTSQRVVREGIDVTLGFNARGRRGPDVPHERPPGVRRVLLLGDSFAEGYYAEEPETVRAVLEARLRQAGCGPCQVVNGGTAGYSTDQSLLFYRLEGRRYGAELVVLLFYYNDVFYNTSALGTGGKPKPLFELEGDDLVLRNTPVPATASGATGLAAEGLRPWRGSMALRLLSNRTIDASPALHRVLAGLGLVQPASSDPPRELWPFAPGRGREVQGWWERTEAVLRALKRDAEGDGARLALLYVPVRFEVNEAVAELTRRRYRWGRRWSPTAVFDRLATACGGLGLPVVDPREALRRAEASDRPAYHSRDMHWNAVGNAIAAGALEGPAREALGCAGPPAASP